MYLRYESDFHHLRDLIISQEDDSNYQEAFDQANAELFDDGVTEQALGWPADCVTAAKQVFTRKEQLNLWRHFVQSAPGMGTKAGTSWQDFAKLSRESSKPQPMTPRVAELAAHAFLASADGSLEGILSKETLPFEQVSVDVP